VERNGTYSDRFSKVGRSRLGQQGRQVRQWSEVDEILVEREPLSRFVVRRFGRVLLERLHAAGHVLPDDEPHGTGN
jgi:hypothetical protein